MTQKCDVPMCEEVETVTRKFDDTNITCFSCGKFICSKCTEQIWTGNWKGEQFYKPTFILPGAVHQIWRCPFCRSTFDRIKTD